MKNQEALEILANHQKWRLGDDSVPETKPRDLTKALTCAIRAIDNNIWINVEDITPVENQLVIVKTSDGHIHTANYDMEYNEFYSESMYRFNSGEQYVICNVVEWRSI